MLLSAIRNTLKTLGTPYFLQMLFISVLVTALIFGLFAFGLGTLITTTRFLDNRFADIALDMAFGMGSVMAAWFLFPVIVPLIGVFFLENIATHIERQEYETAEIRSLPFGGEMLHALKFALLTLALNLLFLPFYILFFFIAPFLFFMLNGYLMGREFFELAGARHIGRPAAAVLRKRYALTVFLGGVLIVGMTSIPIANLFAPFIGAALMVHLFRRIHFAEGGGPLSRQIIV